MINLSEYREKVLETIAQVKSKGGMIDKIIFAVDEGQILEKLKDNPGTIFIANFPPANGNIPEINSIVFFLLEKTSRGEFTDEEEFLFFADKQRTMELIKSELRENGIGVCTPYNVSGNFVTEYEYNIYGGFSGMSVSFKIIY